MTASARTVQDMRGILSVARKLGVKTFEMPGWENRGHGVLNPMKLIGHHTAAEVDVDRILRDGRSDLPGPLCNFALHRDGSFGAVAAGTASHAGKGIIKNSSSYGTEATGPIPISRKGTDAFPQYRAFVLSQAAICIWHDWSPANWLGHKESALPKGRKIDPVFDCGKFRADMAKVIAGWKDDDGPWEPTFPIQEGQHNHGVLVAQKRLNRHGANLDDDGRFGPLTEKAVRAFQAAKRLPTTGIVDKATWDALAKPAS